MSSWAISLPVDLARKPTVSSRRRNSGLSCSMSRGERSRDPLHLDVVDHRREDLLARAVLVADRDPDDLAALVLARLVAEPDRGRLAAALELVDEGGREEVEREQAARHGESQPNGIRDVPATRDSPRCRSAARSGTGRSPSAPAPRRSSGRRRPSSRRNTVSMSARVGGDRDHEAAARRRAARSGSGAARARWRGRRSRRTGARSGRPALPSADHAPRRCATPSSASSSRAPAASSSTRSIVITSRASMRQHGGRVPGAGPDLQHALGALQRQRLADRGHDPGLGDRLAVADRQRGVGVGAPPVALRHEQLARDRRHRRPARARRGSRAGGAAARPSRARWAANSAALGDPPHQKM